MIASDKGDEFVSGFVHQWLGMDRLDFFQVDTKQFRDFDESAKVAARREVYETFSHLLRRNGSLTKLPVVNESGDRHEIEGGKNRSVGDWGILSVTSASAVVKD